MTTKLEAKTYTQKGTEAGTVKLPEQVFGVSWNADLVHRVVTAMQGNARNGTAHTKDRSEVRGGGRKPWRQKGTGRARHGSRRSPLWTGGGVTFGPRNERDFSQKINRKMRARALASVLSKKHSDGELLFVDALVFDEPKTKEAREVLQNLAQTDGHADLATKQQNAALIVLSGRDENTEKSFKNLGPVDVVQAKDVNPVALLTYKYVVVASPETTLAVFESRVGKQAEKTVAQKTKTTVKQS